MAHSLVEMRLQRACLAKCLTQHALVNFVESVGIQAVQRLSRTLRAAARVGRGMLETATLRTQAMTLA